MSLIRKNKVEDISIDDVSSQKILMLARRIHQVISDVRESWDCFTDEEKTRLMEWGMKLGSRLASKAGGKLLMGDWQDGSNAVMKTLAETESKNLHVFMNELMKGFQK